MNSKIVFYLFASLIFHYSSAQEWKADVSYKYMYSSQLDKSIQTYNFSRPLLLEKQPLLMNGINTSISYIFKNERNLKHGLNVNYAYFRSSAENENFNNTFNLHFLNLGYILHYENAEKWKGLYSDLIISATSSVILRKINGEPFVYDETRSKAFGIGGDVQLKFGTYINLKNKSYISPFISLSYTPYLFSPNNEAVINQTKGLITNNWTSIVSGQIGLAFRLKHHGND